ncbi:ankyrin repeat-containing domain protein [Aspergillus multicolor]|uniref:ankyrin repeat-containing domain protein n=1 Tax=Aspergillus multicolor TaxID=41759 RepID=UPI003CCE256E
MEDFDFRRVLRALSDRIWKAAPGWNSKYLVDYFLSRIDEKFYYDRFDASSLLEVLIRARCFTMLGTFLAQDQARRKYFQHTESNLSSTLLATAITENSLEALQILLDAGADARSTDIVGPSPLHLLTGSLLSAEVLELLIAAGADVWATTIDGSSTLPIQRALNDVRNQRAFAPRLLEIMLQTEDRGPTWDWKTRTLVSCGADIFASNEEGYTTLGRVAWYDLSLSAGWAEDQPAALRMVADCLIRVDPHIWPPGHIGRQLWECAQRAKAVHTCQLLLFDRLAGTGVSTLRYIPAYNGSTLLHILCTKRFLTRTDCAAKEGRFSHVSGCWPAFVNRFGEDYYKMPPGSWEPILNGLDKDRFSSILEMISILLDNGASTSAENVDGEIPMYLTARLRWPEFLAVLLRKKPNEAAIIPATSTTKKPLLGAIMSANAPGIQLLLDHGADILAIDSNDYNALHCAARSPCPDVQVLKMVIQAGCPISVNHPSIGTAIHIAAVCDFVPALSILHKAGCPIVAKNADGETALTVALWAARYKCVGAPAELIRLGGRKLVEFADGGSGNLVCLMLQPRRELLMDHEEEPVVTKRIVRLLLQHGAKVLDDCEACWERKMEWELSPIIEAPYIWRWRNWSDERGIIGIM